MLLKLRFIVVLPSVAQISIAIICTNHAVEHSGYQALSVIRDVRLQQQ